MSEIESEGNMSEKKLYTIPIDGVPEGWEPIAFRVPKNGESFINLYGSVETCRSPYFSYPRIIIRKKWTAPAWLKEAGFKFLVRDGRRGYVAYTYKPQFLNDNGWFCEPVDSRGVLLGGLNFTPPDFPEGTHDKDTLIEL